MWQKTSTYEHSLPSRMASGSPRASTITFLGAHAIPETLPCQAAVAALVSLGDAGRIASHVTVALVLELYCAQFGLGTCSIK
jgi:hypothetical protein